LIYALKKIFSYSKHQKILIDIIFTLKIEEARKKLRVFFIYL